MNLHFKRHNEIDRRADLLRAAVLSLRQRIRRERHRQLIEETNRQRRELGLTPMTNGKP